MSLFFEKLQIKTVQFFQKPHFVSYFELMRSMSKWIRCLINSEKFLIQVKKFGFFSKNKALDNTFLIHFSYQFCNPFIFNFPIFASFMIFCIRILKISYFENRIFWSTFWLITNFIRILHNFYNSFVWSLELKVFN